MVYNSIDDVKKALETAVTNKDARLYLLEPGNIKISVKDINSENSKVMYKPILINYPDLVFNVDELNNITDEVSERLFALKKSHIVETAKKTVESQEKGETIVRDSSSSEVTDIGSGTILSTIVAASNKQEEQLEKEESIPPIMDDSMKNFLQNSKMYNDAKKTVEDQEKGETIIRDSKSSIVQNSNSNSNSTLSSIVSATSETSEYASSPDMLTGTGYTQVMKPINIEEVPETTIPKETVIETPKDIEPGITRAPQKVPKVKKFTPVNTPKKESGIADGIILAVIVLVYIAIIVNLVIRLK